MWLNEIGHKYTCMRDGVVTLAPAEVADGTYGSLVNAWTHLTRLHVMNAPKMSVRLGRYWQPVGDGQRQPNECGLFTFVCPHQNQVLDRPHRYLIHRIFKISVVLLK